MYREQYGEYVMILGCKRLREQQAFKLRNTVAVTINFYIISSVMHAFWLVLTYDLLKDRPIDDFIIKTFFNSSLSKTNRFQVAVPRVPLFCSYHILTSFAIYYWTDALQLGIYLLSRNNARQEAYVKRGSSRNVMMSTQLYSDIGSDS